MLQQKNILIGQKIIFQCLRVVMDIKIIQIIALQLTNVNQRLSIFSQTNTFLLLYIIHIFIITKDNVNKILTIFPENEYEVFVHGEQV